VSDVIAPAKPDTAQLQKSLKQVNESMVPGNREDCPSCDKTGLAILVTLFGVIPTQNYGDAQRHGYDWVSYMERDSSPFASSFDPDHYLDARKLEEAKSGNMLECSHYVARRLRQGYLYVHYPDDKSWEAYAVQPDGRLLRMQLDMVHAMGKGDAACLRFKREAGPFLLTVDAKKHPVFFCGFSDAPWTRHVREEVVQPNPAAYMKRVTIDSQRDLVSFEGDNFIKNTVLGFQDHPMTATVEREVYPRVPCASAKSVYDTMLGLNKPMGKGGLILALEDDIGIATQLNFLRNMALIDIMGEGDGYTEADKNKMVTAGMLDSLKNILGDSWNRLEKHLAKGQFTSYLEKYTRCEESKANFDTYSADYTRWMQYLLTKKHHRVFDPNVARIGLQLAEIVVGLFQGSGLTQNEFDKVLQPQFSADATADNQLFWRGAAANDNKLLALLANTSIDRSIIEGNKKYREVSEQIAMLQEVREAKTEAAKLNEAAWSQLARVLTSRAQRLHAKDAKAFRRAMRRIQAITLVTENVGVLQTARNGDATGYLQTLLEQQERSNRTGKPIRFTPKNRGQTATLIEVVTGQWRPGEAMPASMQEAANALGVSAKDLPKNKTVEVHESAASKGSMRGLIGLNAGLAAVQAFALYASLKELGVDIDNIRSGKVEVARLTKDLFEASAAVAGSLAASFELAAVRLQLTNTGVKTVKYWVLSRTAAKLVLYASIFETIAGANDAVELWNNKDKAAGAMKGASTALGAASGVTGYAAVRMVARAGLEEAAKRAAVGTAGEIAAEAATGAAVARGGAVVSSEVPPAAMVLTVVSTALWIASIATDMLSKYLVTTPLEKWADRSFVGLHQSGNKVMGMHTSTWGKPFTSASEQLDALLRLLYAAKVEQPSSMSLSNTTEITVPAFGVASELDINVHGSKSGAQAAIGRYQIQGKNLAPGAVPVMTNLTHSTSGIALEAEAEREGEGLKITLHIGAGWMEKTSHAFVNALMPLTPVYNDSKANIGAPKVDIQYWPNRAAYPTFSVDGRDSEEEGKEEESEAAKK